MSAEKTEFDGGCHCGAIRYKVRLALGDPPTAGRCNCTICQKTSFTGVSTSKDDFTLVKPASRSDIAQYHVTSRTVGKYFCTKCGVHVWGEGFYEYGDQKYDYFSINLVTLDQPQEGLDLSKFKMNYIDGLNDNWFAGGKDQPWPNGVV